MHKKHWTILLENMGGWGGVLLFYPWQINAWLSDWGTLCILERNKGEKPLPISKSDLKPGKENVLEPRNVQCANYYSHFKCQKLETSIFH